MGLTDYEHGLLTTMLSVGNMKWNFRFLDILLLVATGLVGWNLLMTIGLKSTVEVLEENTNLRIIHLEDEREKGERFTQKDGNHIIDILDRHIERTEPKINEMHRAIVPRIQ